VIILKSTKIRHLELRVLIEYFSIFGIKWKLSSRRFEWAYFRWNLLSESWNIAVWSWVCVFRPPQKSWKIFSAKKKFFLTHLYAHRMIITESINQSATCIFGIKWKRSSRRFEWAYFRWNLLSESWNIAVWSSYVFFDHLKKVEKFWREKEILPNTTLCTPNNHQLQMTTDHDFSKSFQPKPIYSNR